VRNCHVKDFYPQKSPDSLVSLLSGIVAGDPAPHANSVHVCFSHLHAHCEQIIVVVSSRLAKNEQIIGGKVRITGPGASRGMRESKTAVVNASSHHSDPESHARSQKKPLHREGDADSDSHDESLLASYSDIAGRMQSEMAASGLRQKEVIFADPRHSSRRRESEKRNGKDTVMNDDAREEIRTHATYLMHRELRDMESRLSTKVGICVFMWI
jgi:hypothetical protein